MSKHNFRSIIINGQPQPVLPGASPSRIKGNDKLLFVLALLPCSGILAALFIFAASFRYEYTPDQITIVCQSKEHTFTRPEQFIVWLDENRTWYQVCHEKNGLTINQYWRWSYKYFDSQIQK